MEQAVSKPEYKNDDVALMHAGTKFDLAERMKSYEKTDAVAPFQAFMVRADGNCFSTYTCGFPKPFDAGFNRAMIKTANGVMNHFNARTVFVCSDEITLIFNAVVTKDDYDKLLNSSDSKPQLHIHAGRHNKIESLVSAKCSVLFNKYMLEEIHKTTTNIYNENTIQKVKKGDAIFDARIIPIPLGSEIEIVNNIIWRSSYDCYRNTVSSYGRYILGHKACLNKNCNEMIKMMKDNKGFDFDTEVSIHYKFGVMCKKVQIKMKNEKGEEYTRTKDYNFSSNLIKQDRGKTLELFFEKYYSNKIECVEYVL